MTDGASVSGPFGIATRHQHRLALVTACVISLGCLFNDFVYDDLVIIRDNARVQSFASSASIWLHPYWPPPFVEQLYRPLTLQLLATQYIVGAGSPFVFRLVSCLLYVICAALVWSLARNVLDDTGTIVATLLFAVHPVHVEAIALAVGQAELAVAIISLIVVVRYVSARRSGGPSVNDWLLIDILFAAATLFKENGFVIPALLVVAELTILRDTPRPGRVKELAPGYVRLVATGLTVIILRRIVLGGSAFRVVPVHTLATLDTTGRVISMLGVVPLWFHRFFWPAHLQVDYAPDGPFGALAITSGVALVVCVGSMLWLLWRRSPTTCFGILWCVVALLPVSNIVPTGVVLAERTLFLPSVGFVLAVGGLSGFGLARWKSQRVRRVAIVAFELVVLLGAARSISRDLIWNSAHIKVVTPAR